jgi:hypothetical protein
MKNAKSGKTGRESDYRHEYCDIARKLCQLNAYTDLMLAKHFGVVRSTISKWKVDHPEFKAALKEGKELPDANVLSAIYQAAVGFESFEEKLVNGKVVKLTTKHAPSVMAGMYWLNNRQRKNFSRNPDPVLDDTPVTPVKIIINTIDASKPPKAAGDES